MEYSDRVLLAFERMFELHRHQRRKMSGAPYMTHLLSVAALVGEYGGDEDQFIAALLHDAVEDAGGRATFERLRAEFGDRVADYVWACSDSAEDPKPPWRPRKERYLAHLREAPPDVRLISAADKLHNARSLAADLRRIGPAVWEHFKGGHEGTLWYYGEVLRALGEQWRHPILDELERAVDDLLRVARDADA
ncbi:MAG TPA: HD domain-containing protein [Candidatus Hydrogenedentes bacterium]|nr:HD domain-containing protein [Candidatus Hydrogenedentota bacterium]